MISFKKFIKIKGNILEDSLKRIVWDNFDLVRDKFSEKVEIKLRNLKAHDSYETFCDYLELIFDMDEKLYLEIKNFCLNEIRNDSDNIIENLANLLEIDEYKKNYYEKIKYLELAKKIIDNKKLNFNNEYGSKLYFNYAKINNFIYNLNITKEYYKKALKIRLEVLGKNHPDTANSYYSLGNYFNKINELDKTKEYYEKALKIRLEVLGENHPDIASSYYSLGNYFNQTKNLDKSKEYYEKALKKRLEILGENNLDTASSYYSLGNYFNQTKNLDKSKEYFEKALKIRLEILGENHLDTASSYNGLGNYFLMINDLDKSKEYFEKALRIRLEILGKNHPYTAISYYNLGIYFFYRDELDKTKEYHEKALRIRLEVLGKNHSDTANSYYSLGNYFFHKDELDKTKEYHEKALKIRLKVLGENHSDTANSYYNLGICFSDKDELDKSKKYFEKALKIRLKVLGENNLNTASAYNNLGVSFSKMKELDKSKEYYEKALLITLKISSLSNKDIKLYLNNLRNPKFKKFFIDSRIGITSHITKAKIKNFKLLEDFEIEFSKRINIIIGQNSSGKTSLLQALTLALLEENFIGESNEKYHNYITKSKEKAEITLSIDKYKKEVEITSNERKIKNDILSPFILSYGSNIFTKYKIEVTEVVQDLLGSKICKDFATSIFKDYTDEFYNPKSILNELERSSNPKALEIKKLFINTINSFQDEYQIKLDNNKYCFEHNNKNIFKLENLSEGYRNNILLISDILIRVLGIGKTPEKIEGIILIDEFDRHLHPKWQSNIVSRLSDIFPKIQFILTTHNPMTILDRNEDEITIIKEVDGKLISEKGNGTKKIDVGTILLKYFGVESLVGQDMQDDLTKYTKLKLQDELSEDEERELDLLTEELDETVATNFIYNKGYFKFLKFLKVNKDIDFEELNNLSDDEIDELLGDFEKSL